MIHTTHFIRIIRSEYGQIKRVLQKRPGEKFVTIFDDGTNYICNATTKSKDVKLMGVQSHG